MGKFLALVFVLALAVGMPVFWMMVRPLTGQMEEIAQGAARMAGRDFSVPLKADGPYRELNALAANINQMAKEIQGSAQGRQECEGAQEGQTELLDVSHELKTPLTIISSQVEMLQCMGDQVDRTYYYDSIVEEVARMSDMVNNLMDLSLMEHQIQKMERQEMNLSDAMEYIRVKYQALFEQSYPGRIFIGAGLQGFWQRLLSGAGHRQLYDERHFPYGAGQPHPGQHAPSGRVGLGGSL